MRFQTHRYVTGEQFFGREALLHELRHRQQPLTWLLGNRRSGKTSVLREIDHRNQQGLWPGTVLTVDVQGAGDREGIREAFLEALDEKPQLLNHPIEELERLSMNSFLNDLGKRLSAMPPPVWLLFDEFEELVDIAPQDPQLATQLRRFFHRTRAQVIITASWSFFSLDESQRSTSPLLPDFLPPVLLTPWSHELTRTFLTSRALPDEQAEAIASISLGNPYLTQNLAAQWVDTPEVTVSDLVQKLQRDQFFRGFFRSTSVNFPAFAREALAQGGPSALLEATPQEGLFRQYLRQSGWLDGQDRLSPVLEHPAAPPPQSPGRTLHPAGSPPLTDLVVQILTTTEPPLALQNPPENEELPLLPEAVPSCSFLSAAGESEQLADWLTWGTPEYVTGDTPDPCATRSFLCGLLLWHHIAGSQPLQHCKGVEQRSLYLKRTAFWPYDQLKEVGLTPAQALVLRRCLHPLVSGRYNDPGLLRKDLRHCFPDLSQEL